MVKLTARIFIVASAISLRRRPGKVPPSLPPAPASNDPIVRDVRLFLNLRSRGRKSDRIFFRRVKKTGKKEQTSRKDSWQAPVPAAG